MNSETLAELRETFSDSFMRPQAYRGSDIPDAIIEAGLDLDDDGYYCRLSADGYLDCTEWNGPFDTIEEAAQHLIETFGED